MKKGSLFLGNLVDPVAYSHQKFACGFASISTTISCKVGIRSRFSKHQWSHLYSTLLRNHQPQRSQEWHWKYETWTDCLNSEILMSLKLLGILPLTSGKISPDVFTIFHEASVGYCRCCFTQSTRNALSYEVPFWLPLAMPVFSTSLIPIPSKCLTGTE